uniref:Zinc finger, AN1-type domain 4 n=1 Tax=Neogobius melanostomus TaxID=47308 RepID=A0A8C6S5R1_9GOBI
MADRKEPPFFNDESVGGAFHYALPLYDTMELYIETLTGTCFELRVLPFEAVVSVKAKIQRLEGIPVAQQHLIWNNVELDDEHCLHDYGIAEGCTLKLVLAMRGGPINTRKVTVEEPTKDVSELMDDAKEEGWDKTASNKQVTFVVYREGDQLNFFRVVDRGDGTITPLSESLSGGSVYNVYTEEEDDGESAAAQHSRENSITMSKMKLLKAKMEDMNLSKKPKKSAKMKPRPPVTTHPVVAPLLPPSYTPDTPTNNTTNNTTTLSDPLTLDVSPPSPLSTWTLGARERTSFRISPSSPMPTSASPNSSSSSSRAFETQSLVKPVSPLPPRWRGVKVESPGKRPEMISKREARGITRMANQACKEPMGSLSQSELMATLSSRVAEGSSSISSCSSSCRDKLKESLGTGSISTPNKCAGLLAGSSSHPLPPLRATAGPKKKSSSSKHCFHCGKKTGLATSYECRCGQNFCATHRYAETHDCTYDYKSAGRRFCRRPTRSSAPPSCPRSEQHFPPPPPIEPKD